MELEKFGKAAKKTDCPGGRVLPPGQLVHIAARRSAARFFRGGRRHAGVSSSAYHTIHWASLGIRLVAANSAKLRFRLTAKTAPASLRLLSPPDPLRLRSGGDP